MSAPATTIPLAPPAVSSAGTDAHAGKALAVGLVGIVVTVLGLFVSGAQVVAYSWLVGVTYCTAIVIGMLMWVLIHHIFDASWSVVLRRQFEHGLAAFKWLALLFSPLVLASLFYKADLIWPWMNSAHVISGGETVGSDLLYLKKSVLLNVPVFVGATIFFFALWCWLAYRVRLASFRQDADGDLKWTTMNRVSAAAGLLPMALTLTFAAIFWVKSLEYHWYSTMYGVWFFANCARGAMSCGVLITVWLLHRGDYRGILNKNHLHSIGQLMFAFTVFWGYVTFSQYFLIWNANVPEETFWYNLRELNADGSPNQWKWVGFFILFGHFFVPFLLLLSYRFKVTPHIIRRIAVWILLTIFVDICYNVLPALKDAHGDPVPFLGAPLFWALTSAVGVGGVCVWAYLRSFPTTKLIPIRDPRIGECLTYHE